jgi:hypothetical protein
MLQIFILLLLELYLRVNHMYPFILANQSHLGFSIFKLYLVQVSLKHS